MVVPLLAEFPEDPVLVLRAGWYFLVAYYVAALVIVFVMWRSLNASRFAYMTKQRVILAAILAGIFAPSEVCDFFLFNLPGPATFGLLLFLIAMVLGIVSQPGVLLKASFWLGLGKIVGGYYLLPILIVFAIAYAILSIYSRSHGRGASVAT
jgi:hypothetical protein